MRKNNWELSVVASIKNFIRDGGFKTIFCSPLLWLLPLIFGATIFLNNPNCFYEHQFLLCIYTCVLPLSTFLLSFFSSKYSKIKNNTRISAKLYTKFRNMSPDDEPIERMSIETSCSIIKNYATSEIISATAMFCQYGDCLSNLTSLIIFRQHIIDNWESYKNAQVTISGFLSFGRLSVVPTFVSVAMQKDCSSTHPLSNIVTISDKLYEKFHSEYFAREYKNAIAEFTTDYDITEFSLRCSGETLSNYSFETTEFLKISGTLARHGDYLELVNCNLISVN